MPVRECAWVDLPGLRREGAVESGHSAAVLDCTQRAFESDSERGVVVKSYSTV